jgi:hypothetical protein
MYSLGNEEYKELLSDLIQEEFQLILDNGISVGILASDQEKKKGPYRKILGECTLVPEKWKAYCPHDFVITIYEPNCAGLSDEQLRTLMRHELMHIGITEKGKPYVVPHDVEDFYKIINEKGIHWAEI